MEATKSTPSVIAKLMGLDDLPSQPPVHKRQRVLSENYLRKTATIGLCGRSVLYSGPSSGIATPKQQGNQNAPEEETPKIGSESIRSVLNKNVNLRSIRMSSIKQNSGCTRHPIISNQLHHPEDFVIEPEDPYQSTLLRYPQHSDLLPDKLQHQQFDENILHCGVANSSVAPHDRKCGPFINSNKATASRVLRPLQKLENNTLSAPSGKFEINNFLKLWKSRSNSKMETLLPSSRIVVLKSNSEKALNPERQTSFPGQGVAFFSGVRKNCEFGRRGKLGRCSNDRKLSWIKADQMNSSLNESSYGISWNSKSGCKGYQFKQTSSSAAHGASQNGFYLKPEKFADVQCNNYRMRRILPENKLEPSGPELECDKRDYFHGLKLESGTIQGHGMLTSAVDVNRDFDTKLPSEVSQENQNAIGSSSEKDEMLGDTSLIGSPASGISGSILADGQANYISISSSDEPQFNPLLNNDGPLQVWETSNIQRSPDSFNKEGFDFLNYTRSDSEFPLNARDLNQPSPNSVLGPLFQEENVSISEGIDSAAADVFGLVKQHQLLESKSEETYSEEIGLAVSSDEDSEKGSVHFSQDTDISLGPFRAEESRNFSYLLDVLDEARITGINVEMCLKSWHSFEDPVDPTIFEVLEKKYGKQTSWLKSERKLLFDRINVGLKEILNMYTDSNFWVKSLRRRISDAPRRDEIEEELWMLLINEDKDAQTNILEKSFGRESKWLQLAEDILSICKDIENDLFDELLGET